MEEGFVKFVYCLDFNWKNGSINFDIIKDNVFINLRV